MRKLFCLVLFLSGCAKVGGGGDTKFLLPWRADDGHYEFQVVTISTLASPEELRGEAAEVYYATGFSIDGYQGAIARPHLTKSGDVYIPTDPESAIAVGVYAQFDRLFAYENRQHTRSQLNWPRKVGVDLNMVGPDGDVHNNAHYFTNLDVIGLVPYNGSGVPVAVNQGIIAHEHFHAHFQTQVMNVLNRPSTIVSTLEDVFYSKFNLQNAVSASAGADSMNQFTKQGLNNLVLRGWNEGLADLFAGIYTGQADFISASLPNIAPARALDRSPGHFWTGAQLEQKANEEILKDDDKMGIAYGQGTVLARLFYQLAQSGVESPVDFSNRIHFRLQAVAENIRGDLGTRVMDFDRIVPLLLEDFPVNKAACSALALTLSPDTMQRNFSKCFAL